MLERIPQRKLEGTRSARPEELARCFERLIEGWRVDRIAESGVVPVGNATDVRDVEEIENFGNRLQRMRLLEMERPADPHVKRVEIVAELEFRTDEGQRARYRYGQSGYGIFLRRFAWYRPRYIAVE